VALQSLQLRFCLDQFGFSQHLWRSKDTRRRPSDGPFYGYEFALRGGMGESPRHIVRVACLIKANMPQRVTRVPEVYEHEAALCHAFPHKIEFEPGGGGKRRAVTAAHRPVWLGPADTGPSRKNRTHNNRRVLPLDEHRILGSHRKSGRRSTASVLSPHVRSTGR